MRRQTRILFLLGTLASAFALAETGPVPGELPVDEARIERRILELARFGANPEGGVSRVAFGEADLAAREWVIAQMEAADLEVRIDAAGNILGSRAGSEPALGPILFGSHIDSVPGGGNYDGTVGVIAAIECTQVLAERGLTTRHPLQVVVFSDEEGGLVGSRAMVGALTPEALELVSQSGKTIRQGISDIGGEPGRLHEAAIPPGYLEAYLELHIEQGGILDGRSIDIGVVEGIVGIKWWEVTLDGFANHAGTTPMDQRRDALLAAAELIQAVNRVVTSRPGRQVGTVGRIRAEPGAPNVIPGRVVMSLEIRDLSMETIDTLYTAIEHEAEEIASKSEVAIGFVPLDVTAVAAPTDERLRDLIETAAMKLGLSTLRMPSGAGHDAQDIAKIAPIGMIFVPSVGGVSHSPAELTHARDMAHGAQVLLRAILAIDAGALD